MTNPLPDLSKWHEVPTDADIPADIRYVYLNRGGEWETGPNRTGRLAYHKTRTGRYFTADPIPAPRPTPPTKPGAVLIDVTTDAGVTTWESGHRVDEDEPRWRLIAGTESRWAYDDDLVSWTVADITPRTVAAPDPLDESNHSDRIDSADDYWMWRESVKGEGHWTCTFSFLGWQSLSMIDNSWGPIRFADEVRS